MLSRLMAIVAVAAVYAFGIGSLVLIVIGASGLASQSHSDGSARLTSSSARAHVSERRDAVDNRTSNADAAATSTGVVLAYGTLTR